MAGAAGLRVMNAAALAPASAVRLADVLAVVPGAVIREPRGA